MDDIYLVDDHITPLQVVEFTICANISRHGETVDIPMDTHDESGEEDNQGLVKEQKLSRWFGLLLVPALGPMPILCRRSQRQRKSSPHTNTKTKNQNCQQYNKPPPVPINALTQSRINKVLQTAIIEILIIIWSTHWSTPISSITTTIAPFVSHWERQSKVSLLAVEIHSRDTYAAIDINNHRHSFKTAHKQNFVFPVMCGRWRGGVLGGDFIELQLGM
ncbi:hypothetical protein N7447_008764 [Penicillium robsamsonii]|uniref:uncharacterized protein n=1 Tax=Penicillium robsamsonii TaxID=1792511 RepID=UPI002549397B|nr:uncharacterized protein N7447_008764 [Penicillium robsamsonii]KAJ5816531.1 hypothetical protein N7447_008764 [Penicillium robsamsonii]